VLAAFETVRARIEPNWAQHFASRLSGVDGLGLVTQVAHDFRSPLSAVLFLADLMLKGRSGDLTALQQRQIALMYSATLGLSELASNVIEMASDGNRLTDDQPSSFSLNEILDSVRSIVRPMAEEKGVPVRVSIATNPFRVGHSRALSRVLLNLTVNALKYTDRGSVQITVREIHSTRLEFSVRDTGKGIDPGRLDSLYEAFRRPSEGGDRYAFSGTGLGLSLCRRLVQIMRSELHVESKKAWGTRFFFELDLSLAPPSAVAPPSPDVRLQDHLVAADMLPRSRPLGHPEFNPL
jgi:signal transduction histidine kinase